MNVQKERASQQGPASEAQQQTLTCEQALPQAVGVQVSRVAKVTQQSPAAIVGQEHVLRWSQKGLMSQSALFMVTEREERQKPTELQVP